MTRSRKKWTAIGFVIALLAIIVAYMVWETRRWAHHITSGTATTIDEIPMANELVSSLVPIGDMPYVFDVGRTNRRLAISGTMTAFNFDRLARSSAILATIPYVSEVEVHKWITSFPQSEKLTSNFPDSAKLFWRANGWDVELYFRRSDGAFTLIITEYDQKL